MTTTSIISDFGNKIGGAAKDRAAARGPRATPAGETTAPRARQPKPLRFDFWIDRATRVVFVTKRGDRAQRRLREFANSDESRAFRAQPDHIAILTAAWEATRESSNVTEDKCRGTTNRPRVGVDHRAPISYTPRHCAAEDRLTPTEETTMPKFDVWMETGVCVTVPRGTDASTDAGLEAIKAAAVEKFRQMLDNPEAGIDFMVEPFGAEQDE